MAEEFDPAEVSQGVNALTSDAMVVSRYGEDHPGVVVGVRVDHGPPVTLLVLLWDDTTHQHESALRALVAHPRDLVVHASGQSPARLEAIKAEIRRLANTRPHGAIRSWGPDWGVLSVRLRADQEPLAAELHQRFGDVVSLAVGSFPYPADRPLTRAEELAERYRPRPSPPAEEVIIPGLQARLDLSSQQVQAGADSRARIVLTNVGRARIVVATDQPLVAQIVDPDTGEVVGGFNGPVAGTGIGVNLDPGHHAEIPVLIGTASFRRELGYALPAGRYRAQTHIPIYRLGEPAASRGVLTVPPIDILIVD